MFFNVIYEIHYYRHVIVDAFIVYVDVSSAVYDGVWFAPNVAVVYIVINQS